MTDSNELMWASSVNQRVKSWLERRRCRFNPWVGKIP